MLSWSADRAPLTSRDLWTNLVKVFCDWNKSSIDVEVTGLEQPQLHSMSAAIEVSWNNCHIHFLNYIAPAFKNLLTWMGGVKFSYYW